MNIHSYLKDYLLEEQNDVLSDQLIADHIRANNQLSEEQKNDLLEQLERGDLEDMSPGLRKWVWIGAVVVIIVVLFLILR